MKVRLFGLLIVCLLVVAVAISNSPSIHSQGKPASASNLSKYEQDLLSEINQARAHPEVYASYLEKLKPLFVGKVYRGSLTTKEGWAAVEDAIAFLRAAKPQPPLNTSSGLSSAASSHLKEQSGSGSTGHKTGGSGAMIEDRVKPFGSWEGGIGENLSYGNESARERLLTWLIDDGVASRGHRNRVMSSDYKVAGVCCGPHPEYQKMCVLTLAGGFMDSGGAKPATDDQTKSDNTLKSQPTATQSVSAPAQSNSNKSVGPSSNSGASNSNKTKANPAKPRSF
jgi:uncharacterized protein YkwD